MGREKKNRLDSLARNFHSRKQFMDTKMVFMVGGAARGEVSFRTCGRHDGGNAVCGGGSIL